MLNGIFFFTNGSVQFIGEINDYTNIISSMDIVLNRIKTDMEDKRRLGQYTSEDLKQELERRNEL